MYTLNTFYLIPSRLKLVVCSTISAILVAFIAKKLYRKRKQEREEAKIRERLDTERRERRARSRPHTLSQDQLCVVCSTNPKEVNITLAFLLRIYIILSSENPYLEL